jgi:hypothetical protein
MVQRARALGFNFELSSQAVDSVRRALSPEQQPPGIRHFLESVVIPEVRPAYSKLLVDTEGYVWARRYYGKAGFFPLSSPAGRPVEWEVFAPEGEWLGSVETPERFTVFEIGTDYVLGVLRDELGIEHVQVHELLRGR